MEYIKCINNRVDLKNAQLAFVYFLPKRYFKISTWLLYTCLGISIIYGL